jgi:thioredoxin 1
MYKSYGEYHQSYPLPANELEPNKKYSYDLMSGNDLKAVLDKVEIILVDAWAPWCQPCKKAGQKFEALGQKFESFLQQKRLLLLKDNIDDEENSHHRPLVEVVPTFFIYVQGKLKDMVTGLDFDRLESFLTDYFQHVPTPLSPSTPQTPVQVNRSMPQIKQQVHYPPKNI